MLVIMCVEMDSLSALYVLSVAVDVSLYTTLDSLDVPSWLNTFLALMPVNWLITAAVLNINNQILVYMKVDEVIS